MRKYKDRVRVSTAIISHLDDAVREMTSDPGTAKIRVKLVKSLYFNNLPEDYMIPRETLDKAAEMIHNGDNEIKVCAYLKESYYSDMNGMPMDKTWTEISENFLDYDASGFPDYKDRKFYLHRGIYYPRPDC